MVKMPAGSEQDLLQRLQDWYLGECNGDWEHSFGVKIDTLDNPGWMVTVDLAETQWELLEVPQRVIERSEHDWVQAEVRKSQFVGVGGPRNLREILSIFFSIIGLDEPEK